MMWSVKGRERPPEAGSAWRGLKGGVSHAVLLWAMAVTGPAVLAGDAAAQTNAQTDGAAPVVLDTLIIGGTPQARYDSRKTDVGGRLSGDITEIPRTIDVVPEQLLQDQHAREMEEVYRYFPNVVNNDGYGGTREDYIIRGFRRRDDVYRNGVRLKSNSRIDPSTIESIQIIKGPVSDIGQMTPGGLVNITTKKPSWTPRNHLEVNVDSHGERQTMFDSTGALSENFAYRVVGSAESSNSFRDETLVQRQFFAPTLSWVGASGASVTVGYEFSKDKRPLDRGFITYPAGGGLRNVADVSRSTRYDANFSKRDSIYHQGEVDVAIPLHSDKWTLEGKLFYNNERTDEIHTEVRSIQSNGLLVRRVEGNDDRNLSTAFGRLQTKGEFEALLPVKVATGIEYRTQKESWINYTGADQVGGTVSNPMSWRLTDNSARPTARTARRVEQTDFGPFIQADISLLPTVTLTLGARYEFSKGSARVENLLGRGTTVGSYPVDRHLTKTAGVMWKAFEDVSFFANYADTFQPHNFYNGDTQVFPAEKGRQYEVGSKVNLMGERLFMTASLFDIKQSNVVESVNGVPVLTGGQKSRGAELSVVGNPTEGWNIRAAVGYVDAEIESADRSIDGNRPTNVPTHNASLWSSYEFKDPASPLVGLGLGTGVTLVGNRYGDAQHSFELGSYTLVDVGAWYYIPVGEKKIRLDLGVKNVTDKSYLTASGGTYRVSVGAPRTVYGGISLDF
ncbi:TonB-dependent siderophore receptor [Azospirillum sp. 412522]|nr:TonB-dependent siderophore receptor [Azospirillum sp. 412522]MBY6264473.1 TonB-dependent siderophore receptor [Azospirillum sp. 412522]